jgi:hypothetical protein
VGAIEDAARFDFARRRRIPSPLELEVEAKLARRREASRALEERFLELQLGRVRRARVKREQVEFEIRTGQVVDGGFYGSFPRKLV